MVFTPLRVVTQESEFPHRISGRQVAMLTRCDLVDSDLTVENGGQDELGAVGDVITTARRLDVRLDGRSRQPEDRPAVGVALALTGEDDTYAPARPQPPEAHLPSAHAVHEPACLPSAEGHDSVNRPTSHIEKPHLRETGARPGGPCWGG